MAVIDPYAPCPCGSGQKFKWCCQKVEAFAERAERLYEGGQIDAALGALDEGLRKVPDNPWLLVRKALIHERREQPERAKPMLEQVLARQPGHLGAQSLMLRVVLESEGAAAAAAQLQRTLTAIAPEHRRSLAPHVQLLAVALVREGVIPAALKHADLARAMGLDDDEVVDSIRHAIEVDPANSPWMKQPYELSPTPEGLAGEARARFDRALR